MQFSEEFYNILSSLKKHSRCLIIRTRSVKLLVSVLPLLTLLEVVVVQEHVERSEVEEEAHVEQSQGLGDSSQEKEEEVIAWTLLLHVAQHGRMQLFVLFKLFLLRLLLSSDSIAIISTEEDGVFIPSLLLLNGINQILFVEAH